MPGVLLVAGAVLGCACSRVAQDDAALERHLRAGVRSMPGDRASGSEAFGQFREAVAAAAADAGDQKLSAAIRELEPGRPVPADRRRLAGRLLRAYVVGRYAEPMLADLQQIVGFRTFAVEGRENWDAPEFLRQREWLRGRAERLGLQFRSFDGRVDEISLAAGERVLGILTHGDVQGVEGQQWSSPPWEARRVGDRIIGRGTEDDKGPIVTTIYVFAALRDSGWPLDAELRLIVSNGEESSWEEIPYYLERRAPPDVTIGFDASYPVTHAQKAWCEVSLSVPAAHAGGASSGWEILSMSGGSGLSMIPPSGRAVLRPPGALADGADELRRLAAAWSAAHPPARLTVEPAGDRIEVTAQGRGGHSSEPASGHNALGDLTAFLASVPLADEGGWNWLARLLGRLVGTETDGASLGLAHTDEVMGALTVNLALLDVHEGRPRARMSLRVPRGIDRATIERRLSDKTRDFERDSGVAVNLEFRMPRDPHYVPPDGPLVRTLLEVWQDVTGKPGFPVAIGGGTQAQLFPDGVDFGPALAMASYRGHGPDEYMTVDEMRRNAALTIAALWRLADAQTP